jgi:DNA topoisomerase-1
MWKICIHCKNAKSNWWFTRKLKREEIEKQINKAAYSWEKCPRCWAPMVFRISRYWWFYWCSKFPRCRGTKPVIKF